MPQRPGHISRRCRASDRTAKPEDPRGGTASTSRTAFSGQGYRGGRTGRRRSTDPLPTHARRTAASNEAHQQQHLQQNHHQRYDASGRGTEKPFASYKPLGESPPDVQGRLLRAPRRVCSFVRRLPACLPAATSFFSPSGPRKRPALSRRPRGRTRGPLLPKLLLGSKRGGDP